MADYTMEKIPGQIEDDGDGNGAWHENVEVRNLRRAMTAEEINDSHTYDQSVFRARRASRRALRALYGDVWMAVPTVENRGRAWIPERGLWS